MQTFFDSVSQFWTSKALREYHASQDDFHHLGGALAALSPALAAEHFEPVWQRYLAYGPWENARSSQNFFAIGTGVLVPLLGSTAKARYLGIAKTCASWLDDHDLGSRRIAGEWLRGVRHLLRGLRLSGDPFARAFAERFVSLETAFDGPEPEEIRAEASRILHDRRRV